MKNSKKLFISLLSIVTLLAMTLCLAKSSVSQTETNSPPTQEAKTTAQQPQQKITTPPLQLTQEEEQRVAPEQSAPQLQQQIPADEMQTPEIEKKIPTATVREKTESAPMSATVTPSAPAAPEGAPTAGTQPLGDLQYAPTPVKTKTDIELILDASGSMNGLMGASTKMAALKYVVDQIISQPIPEGAVRNIGLRIYGGEKPSEENDCKDTQVLIPIGPLNKAEFKKQINSINALGVTPIGYSLEQAANDFTEGPGVDNVIILVTDGMDSCNANICQIADNIHSGPKKIIINVVGFDLDQKSTDALQCISKNGDGKYLAARSEAELHAGLDQMLMANIPYNLRVKVVSGATPLSATLKVFRSGTTNIVREDLTSGVQFYQLPPGAYDIEVIYSGSKETPLPSKIVRGVEVQATSKAEQIVQFDLGSLAVSAFDQNGQPTGAKYIFTKREDPKVKVELQADAGPATLLLTDGTYDAKVETQTPEGLTMSAAAEGLLVKKNEILEHEFRFQVGKIKLTGKDGKGELVAISYRVTPSNDETKTLVQGTAAKEGHTLDLPPGKYDIYVALALEKLKDLPSVKIADVEVTGGDMLEKTAEIPSAELKLSAKDAAGKEVKTLFTIKINGSKDEPAEFLFEKEPVSLILPPGNYDIKSILKETDEDPPPTLSWENVSIPKDQVIDQVAYFKYGLLKLFGRNSKGVPMQTSYYIYKIGEEEPIATIIGITTQTSLKLIEGYYDVRAEDAAAFSDPKPSMWFHNTKVSPEQDAVIEVVFTNGKLKMMCRGPNDIKLSCDYRVFSYGMDRPLFEGTTTERWKEIDIPPGNYYIEAGYHDEKDEVLLKKWVTIKISQNEMLEEIIRF